MDETKVKEIESKYRGGNLVEHKQWIKFRIDKMSDEQKAELQSFIAKNKPIRIIEQETTFIGLGFAHRKDEVDL
jgi:hypothetical protein